MSLAVTILHIIGASLWIGGLVALLVAHKGMDKDSIRKTALASTTGLALILVTGLVNAGKYGGPDAWFQMGTTPGRVGEKLISWLIAAAAGGYAFHKLPSQEDSPRAQALLVVALLASLGALALGVMLTRGA